MFFTLLGLFCCSGAFSSRGEPGLLLPAPAPHCGVCSCCRAQPLGPQASVTAAWGSAVAHCGVCSCCRAQPLGAWASITAAWGSAVAHCSVCSCCRAQPLGAQASVTAAWGSAVAEPGVSSVGSVVVVQGFSCSAAHGIFPDQELNPCSLHCLVDSYPPHHQGSPIFLFTLLVFN